jgi:nucleoside-diphosphate-sugar epimerase
MKTLVVGGTGLIGGTIALHLQGLGHDVSVMSRKPSEAPGLKDLPCVQGDYINDNCDDGRLEGFEALVFAAAADIRNVPQDGSVTFEEFYTKANDIAVPRFFEAAKKAGIKRAVYIGTFYPQVAPQQIGVDPYVTSRHNTDVAVLALNDDGFNVCSLNPPFVLGSLPGLPVPHLDALVYYAKGLIPEMPVFAPRGGTNHISTHSLAQATANALEKGEGGKPYLIGDENLSWKEYLELWFAAAGNPTELTVSEDEHPMFPNIILFAGPGATVSFDMSDEDMAVLNYDRNQIKGLIEQIASSVS